MVVAEVLVDENGHRPAARLKRFDNRLKVLMPRIQYLLSLVYRVIAVLNDQQHSVQIERLAVAQQGLVRGFTEPDVVILAKTAAQVVSRVLIVEHPHDLHVGLMMKAIDGIAVHEPAHDVISVRAEAEDRIEGRDPERTIGPFACGVDSRCDYRRLPCCLRCRKGRRTSHRGRGQRKKRPP
jgi:hypothetical protein